MTDEDPYYHIGIHSEYPSGGGTGKGYSTMDESSASSYYHEQIDASGVVRVEMVLYRYLDDKLTDSVMVQEWKWKENEC
jgi:hypothetical protein